MINAIELRKVDLNLLVIFAVLFHERSVKRAAQQLFLGQSAVSMALRRLRDLFRDELFVKAPGGIEPTARAVAIAPRVTESLELVRCAVSDLAAFDPATSKRVIRLAMSDDVALWLLPALVDLCRAKAPGVVLSVQVCNWYSGLGLLERDDADLAVGLFPAPGSSYFAHRLVTQRFLTVFDRRALGGALTRSRFLATPHALVSFRGDLTGLVDERLAEQRASRTTVVTVPTFALLGPLLRGRPVLATVPESAARVLATLHGLTVEAPPIELAPYDVAMVWHVRASRDPGHSWFRKQLRVLADTEGTASAERQERSRAARPSGRTRVRTRAQRA